MVKLPLPVMVNAPWAKTLEFSVRVAPLVTLQDARDLLAEGLHLAAQSRAAHPAHPHTHHDPAAVNGHVRRRPLVIAVYPGSLRAAPRAGHRPIPGPRPHDDHLARVFDALDDQCRQP